MAQPLRVLIVEDSEDDTTLLVRELRKGGFEPVFDRVESEEALRAALGRARWDLVLSDYSMPHFDGLSAFEVVREIEGDLPFIFVSGRIGELRAVDAMKRGVNDYILKDNLTRLIPAIQRELRDAEERRRRREAEAALRRGDERLSQLVSGSIQGIIVFRHTQVLFANPAFAEMFGYDTAEEVLGLDSIERTIAPHDRERLHAFREARLRGETVPSHYEYDALRKDGSRIRVEVMNSIIDWDDEPATLSTYIDITARKAAESALRGSEERFKDFADIASDWLWEMDSEFRFTYLSERLFEITGGDPERLLGKTRWYYAAEDPERMAQHRADLEAHRPVRNFTYAYRNPDGTLLYARLNGKPLFDEEGRFRGYRGTGTDVTAEMTARLEADEAHQRLGDAIESLPAAFMLYDREERFVMGNSKAQEFFSEIKHLIRPGVTFERRVRESLAAGNIVLPEGKDAETYLGEIVAQFRDPPPFREFHRGNGRWIRAYDRKTEDGGTVCIRVDITDIKEREAALRASERAVRESEQRFRDFAGTASDWYWETDADLRFTNVGDRWFTFSGQSREEIIGRSRRDFVHAVCVEPELARAHVHDLEQHLPVHNFQYPYMDKAGRRRFVEINGKPIHDEQGRFLGYRGTGRDITREMTARQQANEAHQRLLDAIEAFPASFMLYDKDERFMLANTRTKEMFPEFESFLAPGARYEDWVRSGVSMGNVNLTGTDEETHLRAVLEAFRNPPESREYERADGTWIRAYDRKTADGGTVSVRMNITDLKQQQELIRHSEERYRQLVEGSIQGLLVHRDHKPLYVNAAYARMHGFDSPEEAVQFESALELVDPTERERIQNLGRARMRGEPVPTQYEYRACRKDGSPFWVENLSTAIQWDGEPAVQATFIDVSERKEQEEQIRRREAMFRNLVEGSIQGLLVHRDTKPVYVNQAFARMHGYASADEALEVGSALEFVHPDDRGRMIENARARLRGEEVTPKYEYRGLRKDGSTIWAEILSTVVQWDGEPAIQATVIDVTERHIAQQALEQRERFYRALLENAHDVVAVLDPDSRIRFISASVHQQYGYDPEELTGRAALELIHEEDRTRIVEALGRATRNAGTREMQEFRLRHKDGSWRMQEAIARNLMDDPSVNGLIVNTRDITERRELESQLNAAQRMDAIGRLAGGVAHDFNNLLAVILSFSDMLLEQFGEDDPARGDLQEIIDAANRAAALTRQLLAFSRRQVQQLRVLDINGTIRDMGKMLRRLIGEDVELITHLEPRLDAIQADPSQIEQIVMNLAVNARDAMPKGGRLVIETDNAVLDEDYVERHHGAQPGPHVMLAISDTGTGMPPEVQARIFEPFFTTKEKGKGTGLGLSTVYGIVKQSRGSIWVYSEEGMGTTFRVYLPRTESAARAGKESEPATAAPPATETILLVEDDDHVRRAAQRILEQAGYRLLVADRGAQAIELMQGHTGPIDLLLTDVVMPQMSGPETAERLTQLRPGLNVLFMSGYTDDAIVEHGHLVKGVDLLQKPFTREVLLRRVREKLNASAS